ncbi:hypothetical protein V6N12_008965 [Hibiscus sabdariffa]|uniref:Uncharacterized protein n=1 Tax=Hibiscus sabdariffa TaxID=183260 RepID=A0ABR2C498_9ROSI
MNIAAVEAEEAVAAAAAVVAVVLKEGSGNSISDSLDCNFDHNVVEVEEGFDLVLALALVVVEERIVVGMAYTRPLSSCSFIPLITVSKAEKKINNKPEEKESKRLKEKILNSGFSEFSCSN